MRCHVPLLFLGALLVSCVPAAPQEHGHEPMSQGETPEEEFPLVDHSIDEEIAFSILRSGKPFELYGISHTKEMHLILVRDDLRHFHHLHPVRDAEGMWRVPFVPDAGGTYWLYADFVTRTPVPVTVRFEREWGGNLGQYGFVEDASREKEIDGVRITFEATDQGNGLLLRYVLTDPDGNLIVPEDYLGAKGHSVLLTREGEYIHTHPNEYVGQTESDPPQFFVPKDGPWSRFYRVFTQFSVRGEILTVSFDLKPSNL